MDTQEQIIFISKKEQEEILKILEAYKQTLEAGYRTVKRKKPFQSVILSQLVNEIQRTGKLIIEISKK